MFWFAFENKTKPMPRSPINVLLSALRSAKLWSKINTLRTNDDDLGGRKTEKFVLRKAANNSITRGKERENKNIASIINRLRDRVRTNITDQTPTTTFVPPPSTALRNRASPSSPKSIAKNHSFPLGEFDPKSYQSRLAAGMK